MTSKARVWRFITVLYITEYSTINWDGFVTHVLIRHKNLNQATYSSLPMPPMLEVFCKSKNLKPSPKISVHQNKTKKETSYAAFRLQANYTGRASVNGRRNE
jgi:hypothetical protein